MVEWDERLSVGVEQIDIQHKELFSIINSLSTKDDYDSVMDEFARLAFYAYEHFGYEEYLMNFLPNVDTMAHRKAHSGFTEKVIKFKASLTSDAVFDKNALVRFLEDWLIDHILKCDKDTFMEFKRNSEKYSNVEF